MGGFNSLLAFWIGGAEAPLTVASGDTPCFVHITATAVTDVRMSAASATDVTITAGRAATVIIKATTL